MRPVLALTVLACLSLLLPCGSSSADDNPPSGSTLSRVEDRGITALDQVLRELTNPYSVMYVAASYDDVDWGTLAYYHKRLGARAIVVLATRGASNRPASDSDLVEDRGVVTTRRALAAAQTAGADVYFLNMPDPGNSKSAEDLLKQWGRDQALNRMVRAFRLLRPDVVLVNRGSSSGQPQDEAVWQL